MPGWNPVRPRQLPAPGLQELRRSERNVDTQNRLDDPGRGDPFSLPIAKSNRDRNEVSGQLLRHLKRRLDNQINATYTIHAIPGTDFRTAAEIEAKGNG